MRTLRVDLGPASHPVHVGSGILSRVGELARKAGISAGRALLVTDRNVGALYAAQARDSLRAAGFDAAAAEIPAGESSKSLATYQRVIDAMVEAALDRKSPVFALGGGVVGDLAGFVAATFMRGVPLVQVPTSLVAQVDSALGGKTGVNHREGKNLIGVFHQPKLIVADVATLKTLPDRELREGLAEVIKYGAVMDAPMFVDLERNMSAVLERDIAKLEDVVERSLRCKASVVSRDERESGLRKILNFGHTIGHALEAASGYANFLHGEAVAIGMVAAARLSARHAGLSESDVFRIRSLLERARLPVSMPPEWRSERFVTALGLDKKRSDGAIDFVLISEIGRAVISKLKVEEIIPQLNMS
jgi:3-dehydroquinate synthase